MLVFDFKCDADHRFEGWFKNAEDLAQQVAGGLLSCPVCGSNQVTKLPAASHINTGSGERKKAGEQLTQLQRQSQELLRKFHDYVEKHYDDVGTDFAEEAKKIHHGEVDARNIRGVATPAQVKELHDEGIPAAPLPPKPVDRSKMN